MDTLAVVIMDEKLCPLSYDDLKTEIDIYELFYKLNKNNAYINDLCVKYINESFDSNLLNLIDEIYHFHSFESFLKHLKEVSVNLDYVMLFKKNDIINYLSGDYLDINIIPIVYEKLDLNAKMFLEIMKLTRIKLENNELNKESFYHLWINYIEVLTNLDEEKDLYNYDLSYIYNYLFTENKDFLDLILDVIEYLELYVKEEDKLPYERIIPDRFMVEIMLNLDNLSNPNEINTLTYFEYVERLCNDLNKDALIVKAYACYGGNQYYSCDYKLSEECFLKLLNKYFEPYFCLSLGYIYYYGRVNDGIPQYDLAFKYFNQAAITNNLEALYKLGDMYKFGYYVEKNEEAARLCYESLYKRALSEFYDDPINSNLPDVAIRVAEYLKNSNECVFAMRLYLEALVSINIRDGKFDNSIKKRIIKNINEIYEVFLDELKEVNSIFISLIHFKGINLYIENLVGLISVKTDEKRILFDVLQKNGVYTDQFFLKYDGEILKDFEGVREIDEIRLNELGNYEFLYDDEVLLEISKCDLKIWFEDTLIKEVEEFN